MNPNKVYINMESANTPTSDSIASQLERICAVNPIVFIYQWTDGDPVLPFELDHPAENYTVKRSLLHYYNAYIFENNQYVTYTVYFNISFDNRQLLDEDEDFRELDVLYTNIGYNAIHEFYCGGEKCRKRNSRRWCYCCLGNMDSKGAGCIHMIINGDKSARPNVIPIDQVQYVTRTSQPLYWERDLRDLEELCRRHQSRVQALEESDHECDRMIKYYQKKRVADALQLEQIRKQPCPYIGMLEQVRVQKQSYDEQQRKKAEEKQLLVNKKKEMELALAALSDKIKNM
jgi:hypothetical protein